MPSPDWSSIVHANVGIVTNAALRVLGSVQDAEDVTQDVFLEAFRKWDAVDEKSWAGLLRRMAVCRALDVLRSRKKLTSLEFQPVDSREFSPPERMLRDERHEQLRLAIAALPDRQSEVFCLAFFEQMSHDEIATTLGINRGAVATLLSKAKARLMEIAQRIPGDTE